QFTYFQQVGGFECDPVPVEIAYGLERLTMFVQGVDNMYDIVWARGDDGVVFTYGDVYLENEREYSAFNFEVADTEFLFQEFADREVECLRTLKASLPLPAYDSVLKCCHAFNLLDARGVISATERMAYILRVRTLAKACCASYMKNVVGMDVDTSDLDALLADVPDPLAKPVVEEAADVVPACPEPASGGGCPGAAAAAGDRSERAFEFVTIAEDAVSAPSESSEKEA
ncbi:MAG: glycine--tRNA ligase subunit alpha, partial [Adlercreutzia sp.]|nr:glycine--tRNA ligase subunit alpha [Adlercreutzia sp.]